MFRMFLESRNFVKPPTIFLAKLLPTILFSTGLVARLQLDLVKMAIFVFPLTLVNVTKIVVLLFLALPVPSGGLPVRP